MLFSIDRLVNIQGLVSARQIWSPGIMFPHQYILTYLFTSYAQSYYFYAIFSNLNNDFKMYFHVTCELYVFIVYYNNIGNYVNGAIYFHV